MATVEMYPLGDGAYEYSASLAAAGSTADILLPPSAHLVTVTAESTALVNVYSTTDTQYTVKSGSPTWLQWWYGDVSDAAAEIFPAVTALKATQTGAGASKITVRCW